MQAPQSPEKSTPLVVVVAENHADTRKYLCLYLQGLGHSVSSASTVSETLACLRKAPCDVLISDIGLPDGDGCDLLKQAQLPGSVYAIAMSGLGMNADRGRSKAAGYRHHLLKPFNPDELDRCLEEAQRERAARNGLERVSKK